MAMSEDYKSSSGSYTMESFSDSSPSRASYDDEAGSDYISERTRRTIVGRMLHAVGLDVRLRKTESDFYAAQKEDILEGLLKRRGSRDPRRYRRSRVMGILKRALLLLPVFALVVFGVLHIVQVLLSGASLFGDEDVEDDFLPNWGLPGHFGAGLSDYPTDATRDVVPIPCHSHNDYWRRVPLFDAIHWGCTGVEADVWLFDEELYVGHNTAALTRNRTFQNLYVNPLVELLDTMNPSTEFDNTTGHGVFDGKPEQTLVLLVDIKTSGPKTFPYVQKQLEPLREKGYLSHWDGETFISRAVTVVGTGNTPFNLIAQNSSSSYRDIFFDAPLDRLWEQPPALSPPPSSSPSHPHHRPRAGHDDNASFAAAAALEAAAGTIPGIATGGSGQGRVGTDPTGSPDAFNPSNSYYASVSFTSTVGFVWRGRLSARQLEIVRGQIRGAQRRGLRARYWDTPSWPVGLRNHVWHVLMKEGADVLNVDDLRAAATMNWKLRMHGLWTARNWEVNGRRVDVPEWEMEDIAKLAR